MLYNKRAGVEGTISQSVNALGIRRARYRGQAKHIYRFLPRPLMSSG